MCQNAKIEESIRNSGVKGLLHLRTKYSSFSPYYVIEMSMLTSDTALDKRDVQINNFHIFSKGFLFSEFIIITTDGSKYSVVAIVIYPYLL